jgi:sigma-54 dependent transcriptional regulator, acetoin dehydrogenase operon transcriptional activator AcoR
VFGHEHYAENLEDLACAGAPILHPISGKTIGAVDLTCWRKDAGQLLIALARTTAEQVRQALLTHSNIRELALFQAYLRACRRTTGIVMAFNDDIVMMNDQAHRRSVQHLQITTWQRCCRVRYDRRVRYDKRTNRPT